MSMHNTPLTDLEREGLEKHGLKIGTPSQSSDCFRAGMAWVLMNQAASPAPEKPPLATTRLALRQTVSGYYSEEDFEDWLAGQNAIADTTRFLFGTWDDGRVTAYFAIQSDSSSPNLVLNRGQALVRVATLAPYKA
jgi:hypothetical protein